MVLHARLLELLVEILLPSHRAKLAVSSQPAAGRGLMFNRYDRYGSGVDVLI